VKKTAFKVTRVGQLVAREASERLGVPFGIIDLSLAPTPAIGDSVADILCEMGLEYAGAPGTTAAPTTVPTATPNNGVTVTATATPAPATAAPMVPVVTQAPVVEDPSGSTPFATWARQQGILGSYSGTGEFNRIMFGDPGKTYFSSWADASDYMTNVTVNVWKMNSDGSK
jgi:hypothetical protein